MAKLIWYGRAPSGAEVEIVLEDAWNPDEVVARLGSLDARMKAAGFGPSERFVPARWGGGGGGPGKGKRPDTPPPPGIVVPQHCGEPARYIIYNKDNATAKARQALDARGVPAGKADMWICRKDKECEDVKSGKSDRPWAGFDMKPEPKPAEAKPASATAAPPPAQAPAPPAEAPPPAAPATPSPGTNGTGDKPAGDAAWASFDAKAEALGYSQETIREIAGRIPVVRGETTRQQLLIMLDKMKAAPRRRGG